MAYLNSPRVQQTSGRVRRPSGPRVEPPIATMISWPARGTPREETREPGPGWHWRRGFVEASRLRCRASCPCAWACGVTGSIQPWSFLHQCLVEAIDGVCVGVARRGARWMDSCPNEVPWACACHFAGELQGSVANENLRDQKLVSLG